jgi:peptide/nickel transport system permease protein
MISYITKRLLGMIPLLFGITLISFFVVHLAPGKPTDLITEMNPKVSLQAKHKLMELYGLDKPLHIQYLNWLKMIMRLDFGRSFIDDRPVLNKIAERLPVTLTINVLSLVLIFCVALPIGVKSAVAENSFFDKSATVFVFIGFAVPGFWLALLCMDIFGIKLGILPISGLYSLDFEYMRWYEKIADLSRHLILPVFVSAFGGLAGLSRYVRSNMLEVLHREYIRTARAKGLAEKDVVYKHALKNALLPVVTILGLAVPGLIGGSVIFESVFSIPGMGRLFYEAVMARDYPLIMAELVIGAVLTLLGNLLADVTYSYVDPRIRVGKK